MLSLAIVFWVDLDLFSRQHLLAFKLNMQLNSFTRLFCHNIIQLACEVFSWEREILREDNLSQDVLTIILLKTLLVCIGKAPIDALWLLSDHLVKKRNELEKLCSHLVDLHSDSIG